MIARGFEHYEQAAEEYHDIVEELGPEEAFSQIADAYEIPVAEQHWLRQAITDRVKAEE